MRSDSMTTRQIDMLNNPSLEKIDKSLIKKALEDKKFVIIQFSQKVYSDEILAYLNELCLEYDDNFSIRFYGHYTSMFDCKTLLKLPNLKALFVDSKTMENVEVIAQLKNLTRLSLHFYEMKGIEFLQAENLKNLTHLVLSDTRTTSLNLKYIENLKKLEYLAVQKHTKNIACIGSLAHLRHLGLNSISKNTSLDFINELQELKSLRFVLGGRENLDEIMENTIESLEISLIREFKSINNLSNFTKLEKFIISDQKQLERIHFEKDIPTLEFFTLRNCPSLKSLSGVENLSGLKMFEVYDTGNHFDEFINQKFPKSLELIEYYTNNSKKNNDIDEILRKLGYRAGFEKYKKYIARLGFYHESQNGIC